MNVTDVHAWNPTTTLTICGRAGDEIQVTLTAQDVTCGTCRAYTGLPVLPPEAVMDSNTSSAAEAERERILRILRGFHVQGALFDAGDGAGTVEVRCWHCGVTGDLGDGRDAVTASDVADWCLAHKCPRLAVT